MILWLGFLEAVLERNSAVKDQVLRGRVLIVHGEVAEAQELERGRSLGAGEHPLDLAAGEHGQRVRVQALQIVLTVALGVGVGPGGEKVPEQCVVFGHEETVAARR